MDPSDDDLQMIDAPESSSRNLLRAPESRGRPPNGNMLFTGLPGSNMPNRLQDPQRYATPTNSDSDISNRPRRRIREPSRESSVLANNVANHLSIEGPNNGFEDKVIDLMDDSADEHEPPKPFMSSLPTGLCYDVRMRYHCELDPPKQRLDYHPEDPRRIFKIYKELCLAGLVDDPILSTGTLIPNPLYRIPVRDVTESEVCLVHDKKHFDFMKSTAGMNPDTLVYLEKNFDSIYLNTVTFGCALLSAGGAIETCRAVAARTVKNAIAVIRPPGHHAECNRPMGFCIFDNVSIAAKVCQLDYPETCRKILILDWDVHHGNGIQQAFYQNPNVLYISIHVHEDGNFYPSGPYGDHEHCGAGAGLGKNINIPWPTKGMGDADYMLAFQHVVMPVAYEFDPDLVIIAAGFDAADGDQLGGCFVTPACYAQMTHMLMGLAQGKLVVCLEGGYNLTSISKSALAVTRTLIGELPDRLPSVKPTATGVETVEMVALYQSRFWPCLYPKDMTEDTFDKDGADPMNEVIRYYQVSQLKEKHSMLPVMIYRDRLARSFENQVMATANYEDDTPLIVMFHDPPEIMGTPNPISKEMELHNTWLADGLKHYVDWAVKQGYAVIDVNIPKHLPGIDITNGHSEDDRLVRTAATSELAVYLWENYIDCNDSPDIFFIGIGAAYQAVINLLSTREQEFMKRVRGLINFVAKSHLVPVSDSGQVYWLSKWYKTHSLNYVSNNHLVWDIDRKKPSKRFGNLVRSSASKLNDMLGQHQEEVQDFILARVGIREPPQSVNDE
ncbi:hypothetical protein N7G274_005534 [Stereocaulon virgatum]|uniref:Histone deacetylase n=1 Tax=Stereocaulon virgatum TaxID=373712 RepID=A0ABR4A7G8_9LECA